jgi:N-acetylmuramoyl-L-alanine amidase
MPAIPPKIQEPWMAKSSTFLGLVCVAVLIAGCQQQSAMVPLPSPNFSGPVVMQPPPQPVQPLPRVSLPPPRVAQPPKVAAAPVVPRDWVPRVSARPWMWIVVHHSATVVGGAARFDRDHREKGWDELGYDFVIGNGTDTGDGQIEVGPRWVAQKWGAHTKTPDNRFNERGIGICLVGNFESDRPTAAQMKSLVRLTSYLMRTYRITPDNIIGHRDAKPTECPGRNLSIDTVRRLASQSLADTGHPATPAREARTASTELMVDVPGK